MFVVGGEAVLQKDKAVLCAGLPHQAADETVSFSQMPDQVKVRPVGGGFGGTAAAEILQCQAVAFNRIIIYVTIWLCRCVIPHRFFHQLNRSGFQDFSPFVFTPVQQHLQHVAQFFRGDTQPSLRGKDAGVGSGTVTGKHRSAWQIDGTVVNLGVIAAGLSFCLAV